MFRSVPGEIERVGKLDLHLLRRLSFVKKKKKQKAQA